MKILIRAYAKDKFYRCIKWLAIKMILNIMKKIDEYKKKNFKEIKIVKRNKIQKIIIGTSVPHTDIGKNIQLAILSAT